MTEEGKDTTRVKEEGDEHGPYRVGYGRPPREHRFKKGQPSRNPSGRPKGQSAGRLTLATVRAGFLKAAEEPINIKIDGKLMRVSRTEAIIHRIYAGALNGDARSIRTYFELLQMFERQGAALDRQDEQEGQRHSQAIDYSAFTQEERDLLRSLLKKGEARGKSKKPA